MKFVIEVEDFYLEEEEISEGLKAAVQRNVIAEIEKRIKDRVETAITTRVNTLINEKIAKIIDAKLSEFVATGTIIVDRKEVQIIDHLKGMFQTNHGWNNPANQMRQLAEAFGKELKARYDVAFANQIVIKINEQGMLKDEVVKLLLK